MKKSKKVTILDEYTEINYRVQCKCPHCGVEEERMIYDDYEEIFICENCKKEYAVRMSE